MNKRRLSGIALALAGLGLIASPAHATGNHDADKRWVCHNRAHNPVLIHVDKNSTKYQGHLKHREQEQNLDLVEGPDGSAAAVKAACVTEEAIPGPVVTVTGPATTVTVPGPVVTETGPTVTVTSTATETVPGPTVTGPATEVPGPTTTGPAVEVPGPTTTGPAVTLPGPTRTGDAVVIPGPTTTGKPQVVAAPKPGLIGGPKDTLAYTGANVSAAGLGVLFLGAGIFLMAAGKRLRITRPSA